MDKKSACKAGIYEKLGKWYFENNGSLCPVQDIEFDFLNKIYNLFLYDGTIYHVVSEVIQDIHSYLVYEEKYPPLPHPKIDKVMLLNAANIFAQKYLNYTVEYITNEYVTLDSPVIKQVVVDKKVTWYEDKDLWAKSKMDKPAIKTHHIHPQQKEFVKLSKWSKTDTGWLSVDGGITHIPYVQQYSHGSVKDPYDPYKWKLNKHKHKETPYKKPVEVKKETEIILPGADFSFKDPLF